MTDRTTFISNESGAVTVDWVVLTAALVGLGLAVVTVVRGGVDDVSNDIDEALRSDGIIRISFAQGDTVIRGLAGPAGEIPGITGMSDEDLSAELGVIQATSGYGDASTTYGNINSATFGQTDSDGNPVGTNVAGLTGSFNTREEALTAFNSQDSSGAALIAQEQSIQAEAAQRGRTITPTAPSTDDG
ncbi:MAG: hypothetical protein AAF390_17305 [Pseudomonadota bacterium]